MTISSSNNYLNYTADATARTAQSRTGESDTSSDSTQNNTDTSTDNSTNTDNSTGGTTGNSGSGSTDNSSGSSGNSGSSSGDSSTGGTTGNSGSGSTDNSSGSSGNSGSSSGDSSTDGTDSIFPGDTPIIKDEEEDNNGLGTEAFMRLFLEQLKNQDPTAPMETQEILTQTAQLTQVEAQTQMKNAMEQMTTTMQSMQETNEKTIEAQQKLIETQEKMLETMGVLAGSIQDSSIIGGYNTVGMIGNIAETPYTALKVEKNEVIDFELYFDEPIDPTKGQPKITITDKDNNVIREIDLAAQDEEGNYIYLNKEGYVEFEWDTRDSKGKFVANGDYTVKAEYNLDSATNQYKETQLGRGEVQSILFDAGVPYVKLGDHLTVPIIYVTSYYKKTGEGIQLPDSSN